MKPKAVLAYCREKGIKAFDLRFADLDGQWRHITFPLSALTESAFEEGFGHDIQLAPFSERLPSHSILLPHSEANYLDPFTSQPTLVLLATTQDAVIGDELALDSRCIAMRAIRHLESSGVGDGVAIRSCYQFRLDRNHASTNTAAIGANGANSYLACGPNDLDFVFRCEIADLAADSGLHINRHVSGAQSTSEIYLNPSSLVECCDDIMMIRYLVGQRALQKEGAIHTDSLWLPSQWSILRQGEPIFVGSQHRGLSEAGVYAMGGVIKHSDALAAIALSGQRRLNTYPWLKLCSSDANRSLCRVAIASHGPRARSIEFRGAPASCNPYLLHSAVLMAMIDGIQNKNSPGIALESAILTGEDDAKWRIGGESPDGICKDTLRGCLDADRDFLRRGDVFSDELLDILCQRID